MCSEVLTCSRISLVVVRMPLGVVCRVENCGSSALVMLLRGPAVQYDAWFLYFLFHVNWQ
jgi:hypothetical protein